MEVCMLKDLVLKNRSYRRFYQGETINEKTLLELVELARLSSSGRNIQALKYVLSYDEDTNEKIFKNINWAGYLKEWNGPEEGEKPSAYIVMVLDTDLTKSCYWDHGIAAQSILLGATEKELGGCMFGSIDKKNLRRDINIDDKFEILMVIAIGKPKEIVVLEELVLDEDIKYYRDENNVHHVPKRKLSDIIIKNK